MKKKHLPHSVTVGFFGILLIISLLFNMAIFKKLDESSAPLALAQTPAAAQFKGASAGKKVIDGKVWVQLQDSIFDAYFLTDESCKVCVSLDEMRPAFEQTFPTAEIKTVSTDSEKGQELIAAGVSVVPAIVFDSSFQANSAFAQLAQGGVVSPIAESGYFEFRTNGNKKILSEAQLPVAPEGAELLVVGYTDFFSQDAAAFSAVMPQLAAQFGNNIAVKNNVMVSDIPSAYVAQALRCGVDAEKVVAVQGDYLEEVNAILAEAEGKEGEAVLEEVSEALRKELALWGEERDCYREGEFVTQAMAASAEAQQFGIAGAPAYFVGNRFLAGQQSADVFAAALQEVMAEKGTMVQEITPEEMEAAPEAEETEGAEAPVVEEEVTPEATTEQ